MPPESACRSDHAAKQNNTMTKLGYSRIRIGQKVAIRNRIRWVLLPSYSSEKTQGSIEGTIHWWPGILYKDHGELMCDVDPNDTKFQARCLIEHLKYRDMKTSPAVAYIIGHTQTIRTITKIDKSDSEQFGFDTQGIDGPELKNFYYHFDHMHDIVMSPSFHVPQSQINMFTNAVMMATEALAAEADASPDREGKEDILPVSNDHRVACQVPQTVQTPNDVDSPALKENHDSSCDEEVKDVVRKIGTELEPEKVNESVSQDTKINTRKSAKNGNETTNNVQNIASDGKSVKHMYGQTPRRKSERRPMVSESAQKTKRSLEEAKNHDVTWYSPSNFSHSSSSSDDSTYDWTFLWHRLKDEGWKVINAGKFNKLHDWYYIRPKCDPNLSGCKLGEDYFDKEEDVITYKKRMDKGLKDKHRHSCSITVKKSKRISMSPQDSISSDAEKICWWPFHPIPSFKTVWNILQKKLGFQYFSGKYVPPGSKIVLKATRSGQLNIDYFEDVLNMRLYLCQHGIPLSEGDTAESHLNFEELQDITIWGSTVHLPKRYNDCPINEINSTTVLANVPVFSNKDAWSILSNKLRYREFDGKVYAPGQVNRTDTALTRGVEMFHSLDELRNRVRGHGHRMHHFGRERKLLTDDISDEEYVGLILWASMAPLPVHYISTDITKFANDQKQSKISENGD